VATPIVTERRQLRNVIALAVRERDGDRCVCCGVPIVGTLNQHWAIWKRIPLPPRGSGPVDQRIFETSNLVTVCGYSSGCDRDLRRDTAAARRRGLRLWPSENPLEVPVLVWTGTGRGAPPLTTHVTPYLIDNTGHRKLARAGGTR
jgi:hypothetical protein